LIAALGERISTAGVIDFSTMSGSRQFQWSPGLRQFLEAIRGAVGGASDVAEQISGVSLQMTEAAAQDV